MRAGRIPVATAGTSVPGPDVDVQNGVWLASPSTNTGSYVHVNDNEVTGDLSGNSWPIKTDSTPVFCYCRNLSDLRFDVESDGDEIAYFLV